jgi:hypothetical protein
MTALRLRKTRRTFPWRLDCSRCRCDTDAGKLVCEDCADDQAHDAAAEAVNEHRQDDCLPDAVARDFARVYLDIRYGRTGDATDRLERVLDAAAPQWRRMA